MKNYILASILLVSVIGLMSCESPTSPGSNTVTVCCVPTVAGFTITFRDDSQPKTGYGSVRLTLTTSKGIFITSVIIGKDAQHTFNEEIRERGVDDYDLLVEALHHPELSIAGQNLYRDIKVDGTR